MKDGPIVHRDEKVKCDVPSRVMNMLIKPRLTGTMYLADSEFTVMRCASF